VLLLALGLLCLVRSLYMQRLRTVFPDIGGENILLALLFGLALFVAVSLANALIIRRRINTIWKG